ncbi:signal peptidase II [Vulgatibacter incomptus]|uniref:Lipoprotein signal peptidase n=1 Tax=Vulgatibacter incomptus TaxID=1391653 RepID=A0A0K1P8U0_9BACT|nr:signal peptidase II [Vulgatibacter incomptus]AKU89948.1 Lipoprotein signal peptidase [Vulgatibacter incomptus]
MKRTTGLGIALFLITLILDYATKVLSEAHLAEGPITIVPGWVWLRLAYNRGVAFSIMEGMPHWILGVGALVLICVVVWSLRALATRPSGAAALGLLAAGGIANAIDRLHDGQVTDMISVWRWPVFNVADTAITIGVGLLFWASRKTKEAPEASHAASPGAIPAAADTELHREP